MISFTLNGSHYDYQGDENESVLSYLRNNLRITSAKDGCSGEGTCGACLIAVNLKPKLACRLKMSQLHNNSVLTIEGIPDSTKKIIAQAFVNCGAVQCGFCTPGFIMRTYLLIQSSPLPSIPEIKKAISTNLCRCTGYTKIIEAVQLASQLLKGAIFVPNTALNQVGQRLNKYKAMESALGAKQFTDDLYVDGMLFSALKFSDFPRAKINKILINDAEKLEGVIKVFTYRDVPAQRFLGLIYNDWPLMVAEHECTHYIGDVLAGVVAINEKIARAAVALIHIEYEVLEPITNPMEAILPSSEKVHENKNNLLEVCQFKKGDEEAGLIQTQFKAHGIFQTQRIEHGFLEKESAIAVSNGNGIKLFSQSQGVYEDQRQISLLLGIPKEQIEVELVPNGGGFGGKEDLSVQGHVSLFAYLLKKPVKLTLTRQESIRMHPKRHPVTLDLTIGCDSEGKLTMAKLDAVGDTGAYASVGTKVMERVAGHATGGYYFPVVNLVAKTVYTNNIPSGAMRGFGANQVTFALEVLMDELCEKGGFDRWQFRYDNALIDGSTTSTGQKVYGVGIQDCLLALKNDFYSANYAGLACGIKNSGVGNGMVDESSVKITVRSETMVSIEHGWTEMGQGVHNMAIQTLGTETGLSAEIMEVSVNTEAQIKTGMTTSSRATALLGLAIIDAAKNFKIDLNQYTLKQLIGKTYQGKFVCDWTQKPGENIENPVIHYSYGYAAQLCLLDNEGKIERIIAAHDGGKIMNPTLFEGQIQGAVHMGLGYALCEDLPMQNGLLVSDKLKDCKILRANETPDIEVRMIEKPDPIGPYGAKGVGEIGLVPTAGAVANALYQFDGVRRYSLPIKRS